MFYLSEFFKILKTTDKQYHFVELMGCTGGCINGGGQPIVSAINQEKYDVRQLRSQVMYDIDVASEFRKSHESRAVKAVYEEFLGKPNSHKSHELLHTNYNKRSFYEIKID